MFFNSSWLICTSLSSTSISWFCPGTIFSIYFGINTLWLWCSWICGATRNSCLTLITPCTSSSRWTRCRSCQTAAWLNNCASKTSCIACWMIIFTILISRESVWCLSANFWCTGTFNWSYGCCFAWSINISSKNSTWINISLELGAWLIIISTSSSIINTHLC
jgi:hypothetical protein